MKKFSLTVLALTFAVSAHAQTNDAKPTSSLMKAPEAFGRMSEDQARETRAYTLGVQAVLWGMQWVKAGQSFRMFTQPLPHDQTRSPYDVNPHGVNIWGHAQKLLNADFRTIETPNTETLYSMAIVNLNDGPVVVVHPDFGDRAACFGIARK